MIIANGGDEKRKAMTYLGKYKAIYIYLYLWKFIILTPKRVTDQASGSHT